MDSLRDFRERSILWLLKGRLPGKASIVTVQLMNERAVLAPWSLMTIKGATGSASANREKPLRSARNDANQDRPRGERTPKRLGRSPELLKRSHRLYCPQSARRRGSRSAVEIRSAMVSAPSASEQDETNLLGCASKGHICSVPIPATAPTEKAGSRCVVSRGCCHRFLLC